MADRFDCVVIGAGLVGLAIAFELGERGQRVCVIERDRVAGGTTSRSLAWLNATSKLEPDYHRLNAAGMEGHRRWAERWGEEVTGHRRTGCLVWAAPGTFRSPRDVRGAYSSLIQADYPCRWIGRRELSALEPALAFDEGAEGFLAPADGWLDAPRLARHLAGEIASRGGEIRERTAVTGLSGAVETSRGPVAAERIVIAAGIDSAALAARALGRRPPSPPVTRVPGLVVELGAEAARLDHVVCVPDDGDLNMRPGSSGRVLMVADDSDRACGEDPSRETLHAAVRLLVGRACRVFRDLDEDDAMARALPRTGIRPMPADGRSIAGRLPGSDNLFIAVTHSGITLAPVLGRLLADEIAAGRLSSLLEPFRPTRFAWG